MNHYKSKQAFEEAKELFPGGVNSPVRAFNAVELTPPFIKEGKGAYLYDIDDNRYIDFVLSWGPLILGHGDPNVVKAICHQAQKGVTYGAPTLMESDLANLLCQRFKSIDKIRFVNSGTEATMSAVRLARGYTHRPYILKFTGCYHGHADTFLVKAGSGIATFDSADSAGVPESYAKLTLSLPYNDKSAVESIFDQIGEQIAAVIVEPVAGNMGLILADKEFLVQLRAITEQYQSLLIFDEVMSGLRCDFVGAQNYYEIEPDLTTLGKVIGGGMPVAAYGGKSNIMNAIAPLGDVYQAGTLSGNPLGMVAGATTLMSYDEEQFERSVALLEAFCQTISNLANQYQYEVQVPHMGTMFSIFFSSKPVKNFDDSKACDQVLFKRFFTKMLEKGIYFASSQFETNFISLKHTQEDLQTTAQIIEQVFSEMRLEDGA